MSTIARLVGFCQGMPGVHTFVTPVFLSDGGEFVAQCDPTDTGYVVAFESIDVDKDEGFVPVELDVAAKVGGPAIFAFEASDSWLAIGPASRLADHLQQRLKRAPEFSELRPHTRAAIQRFVAFADAATQKAEASCLFLLMRSERGTYVPMVMESEAPPHASTQVPHTQAQWRQAILEFAQAEHAPYLDAHREVEQRVDNLLGASRNRVEARRAIEAALASILRRAELKDGRLTYMSHRVCHECLFQLTVRFPAEKALEKLLELSEGVAAINGGAVEAGIRIDAMEAVHRFLVQHNVPPDVMLDIRTRHIQLLQRASLDNSQMRHAKRMMAELGEQHVRAEADEFLVEMRKENSLFVATTSYAASFDTRYPMLATE